MKLSISVVVGYCKKCIQTNPQDTKSNANPNPNTNRTTKQHAIVNIRLHSRISYVSR